MHSSVLKEEVIELLSPKSNENFIDATVNGGGHAWEVLAKTAPNGKLLAIDLDRNVLDKFTKEIIVRQLNSRVITANDNFANIRDIVERERFLNVAGIFADLGFSSWQLEESGRGFSFQKDEPLLMTLDSRSAGLTAKEILNTYRQEDLERVIKEYGEERFAGRIAREIVRQRKKRKIEKTGQLVEIIRRVVPGGRSHQRIHPATRTFQALRVEVNQELENLKIFLQDAFELLLPDGRLGIISFHSLEDRLVKNFFRERKNQRQAELLTKKPIQPSFAEIKINPRSRSAKLRVLKKTTHD